MNAKPNISLLILTLVCCLFHANAYSNAHNTASLNKLISELIPSDEPGCSIGVYEKGRQIISKGYGLANVELNVSMSSENVHRMASVSKQFVAMAVHLLADQGKIDLKKDITDYVAGLPEYGAPVSIESMLGHTAGMGDYEMISSEGYDEDFEIPKGALELKNAVGGAFRIGNQDYLSVDEFYTLVKKLPLVITPNETWRYSNMAYVLLAILVEEVSGQSLRDFSDQHIFSPLGMNSTFFADNPTEIIKNRAYGYAKNENDQYVNNMTNLFWVGDGGLHTTIADMQKWDAHFYSPKLGKEPVGFMQKFMSANSQISVNPSEGDDIFYANGQLLANTDNGLQVSHSGGWLGAYIIYRRYPTKQFMNLVMCSNVSIDSAEVADKIDKWYFSN